VNISDQRVGGTGRKLKRNFFFEDMFLEEGVFSNGRAFAIADEAALRIPFTRKI